MGEALLLICFLKASNLYSLYAYLFFTLHNQYIRTERPFYLSACDVRNCPTDVSKSLNESWFHLRVCYCRSATGNKLLWTFSPPLSARSSESLPVDSCLSRSSLPHTVDSPSGLQVQRQQRWLEGRVGVSLTMEIQSGNGEESAATVSATPVSISQSPPGWQVDRSDVAPAHRQDPQAEKRIERFHVPLDSLKRMFEKPAEATTVSTATAHVLSLNSLFMNNRLSHLCGSRAFTVSPWKGDVSNGVADANADPDAARAESTRSVGDERRLLLSLRCNVKVWRQNGMSLMAPFAGLWFALQQFGIFHYYADSGSQTCFSPQTAAFSVLVFFFLRPSPSFFLGEENLLEVKQIIIRKPLLHQNVWWWDRKAQMAQFFPAPVVATSNLSPPNVPGTVTSESEWKALESSLHSSGTLQNLLWGLENVDLRAEGGWETHRCVCPVLVSDTMLFRAYLGELSG